MKRPHYRLLGATAALMIMGALATACSGPEASPPTRTTPAPTTASAPATERAVEPRRPATAERPKTPMPKPTSAPTATAVPTEASPTRTPAPTESPATPNGTGEVTEEPSDQPGPPQNGPETAAAIAALTQTERECLDENLQNGRVEMAVLNLMSTWHTDELNRAAACLSDESIVRVMVLPAMAADIELDAQEADCISQSALGGMIRRTLPHGANYPMLDSALFSVVSHMALTAEICTAPDKFQRLRLQDTELNRLKCIVATPEEAETLLADTLARGPQAVSASLKDAEECLAQQPPAVLIEPLPNCTDEQRAQGLPCRIN